MAKDDKPRDLMGYEAMQQDALRGVVRAALARAASPRGLPGDHHFYISFRTAAPGVVGPDDLLGRYPDLMTVVLQNQFWDLKPGDNAFSVTLQFGGQPKSLSIPYAAVTRFYDPSVQYLLQFNPPTNAPAKAKATDKPDGGPDPKRGGGDEPKIVSLDQFRKK
ncbi:MAG: SspB family protein [Caulobacteraceae bacterium]